MVRTFINLMPSRSIACTGSYIQHGRCQAATIVPQLQHLGALLVVWCACQHTSCAAVERACLHAGVPGPYLTVLCAVLVPQYQWQWQWHFGQGIHLF